MKPNIFEIATSELSQDGFITWLLQWANPDNKMHDEKLNACAVDFVKFLIKTHFEEDLEITSVEAGRQWDSIDIWAIINEKYLIIIEDKTDTKEHSNQLERYKETAMNWSKAKDLKIVCIYLKTGTESKSSVENVKSKGFKYINRSDLIGFFKNYSDIKNDIYIDFVEKITNIEIAEKAFETTEIQKWDWSCWVGFYNYLDSKLNITDWRKHEHPSGGFLGIWWHLLEWKEYKVYIQIEQGDLCFKVGNVKENHSHVRGEWHNILMAKAKETNREEIVKPKRFGNGEWMSVAIVESKDWLGNEMIDKEKVVEN
ncbi:MAG: PD-(D/E)XK nuclease family protein [Fibromonadaceae bacterium]|nr:PD-(D/E)XK nuclease family protein [Fibromonadaceae bacterium]